MNSIETIPALSLIWMFAPIPVIAAVLHYWSLSYRDVLYAAVRMLVQLILIGYVLTYLFAIEHALPVLVVLIFMLMVSSWIALRPIENKNRVFFGKILTSLALGGVITLALVIAVLDLEPWFSVKYVIPLGGMILSNAMNTVCLAAERFEAETAGGSNYKAARSAALQAGMIPIINMFMAVGLVALPGVMTGQILSGVSPLVAVRYQIMIMCMVLNAAAISTICYLALSHPARLRPQRGKSTPTLDTGR